MKKYAAIGHWKGNDDITSIASVQSTKAAFVNDLRANEFVPFIVLTGSMMEKLNGAADDSDAIFEQVKKMTTNYRVWNLLTDYIEQCFDILTDRFNAAC